MSISLILLQLVEGSAIRRPLSELVEDEGIRAGNLPQGFRLGVDARYGTFDSKKLYTILILTYSVFGSTRHSNHSALDMPSQVNILNCEHSSAA